MLDGWVFTPLKRSDSAVIALHGVGGYSSGHVSACRLSVAGRLYCFDTRPQRSRGEWRSNHHVWYSRGARRSLMDRLADQQLEVQRLYGIGQSLGGAIILESIDAEPRIRTVVADSPFRDFAEIASDRLQQVFRMPRTLSWPVIHLGFIYARLRYGVDLRQASPIKTVRPSQVPILLIHGTNDSNIPIRHSRELLRANPTAVKLWEVSGAEHVASLSTSPETYAQVVVNWFNTHS